MLLSQFVRGSTRALQVLYPEAEAAGLVAMLVEEVTGFKRYTHIIEPRTKIPGAKEAFLREAVERLCQGVPIQYVLGYADFCGLRLRVAPGVLIPRPETEELVTAAESLFAAPAGSSSSIVISTKAEGRAEKSPADDSPAARVLDLCTGSGCIAWALATRHPDWQVTAVDLSPEALAIAASQRAFLRTPATVDFLQADLLTADPATVFSSAPVVPAAPVAPAGPAGPAAVLGAAPSAIPSDVSAVISTKAEGRVEKSLSPAACRFDLIVSNPPYICESERAAMRPNVLEHEPAMALFVPDADPLRFYRAIARWAQALLAPGGRCLVEINEALGPETAALFRAAGFPDAAVLPDFSGRDRFVTFSRPAAL